jgi:mannose/fructose-specific phosphotransferase system component IIA
MSEGRAGGQGAAAVEGTAATPGPARGIVVGHGAMASGLVDAVRRIAGIADDVLVAVSNEGKGPDALRDELTRLAGKGAVIVFTDMHAGSCAVAARVACRSQGESAVVCGVNLPMLLDFVFHREMPLEQLVPKLVKEAQASITAHLHADRPVSS